MGCARDIGKIIVFQGKRIDFRITGILENLLFSTKIKQTIFRTKCDTSRDYEFFFIVVVVVVVDVVVDVVVAVVNVGSVVN